MSNFDITRIYLSFIRTFPYYPDKSFKKQFIFLKDKAKYYEMVIDDRDYLKNLNISIPNIGKFRSVLDTSDEHSGLDPFFVECENYYHAFPKDKRQILTPHYPCVIDASLYKKNYQVIMTSLPNSLRTADTAKINLAIRLYPAGLASIRFGCYLSTKKGNFTVDDIITFLVRKKAEVSIDSSEVTVDNLTKQYAQGIINHIHKDKIATSGTDTYSLINIIEAAPNLTLKADYDRIFLPLVCLNNKPDTIHCSKTSLSSTDILIAGPRCVVFYSPNTNNVNLDEKRRCDSARVQRWLKNNIELILLQKYMANKFSTLNTINLFDELIRSSIREIFNKGFLGPKIKDIFALWNYTNLHLQPAPIIKRNWRNRYNELAKYLDKDNTIGTANKEATVLLTRTAESADLAGRKLGSMIRELLSFVSTFKGVC